MGKEGEHCYKCEPYLHCYACRVIGRSWTAPLSGLLLAYHQYGMPHVMQCVQQTSGDR